MSSSTESGPTNHGVLATSAELMSLEAFQGIIWAGFVLCLLAFVGRAAVRLFCFKRLHVEDYLMVLALSLLFAVAVLTQTRVQYVYEMENVGNGLIAPPSTFLEDVPRALTAVLAIELLCVIGVWLVKFNFLLFFKSFSGGLTSYRIYWWLVTVITFGSLVTVIGITDYRCTVSSVDIIFTVCPQKDNVKKEWITMIVTCTIDAVTDIIIMSFPLAILWRIRLSLRKKIALSGIFSLSLVTVVITIIRGTVSLHNSQIVVDFTQSQNISWIWFWLTMEFIVGFIVACLVTFRSLFTHKQKTRSAQRVLDETSGQQYTFGSGPPRHGITNTILNTCYSLEGEPREKDSTTTSSS